MALRAHELSVLCEESLCSRRIASARAFEGLFEQKLDPDVSHPGVCRRIPLLDFRMHARQRRIECFCIVALLRRPQCEVAADDAEHEIGRAFDGGDLLNRIFARETPLERFIVQPQERQVCIGRRATPPSPELRTIRSYRVPKGHEVCESYRGIERTGDSERRHSQHSHWNRVVARSRQEPYGREEIRGRTRSDGN